MELISPRIDVIRFISVSSESVDLRAESTVSSMERMELFAVCIAPFPFSTVIMILLLTPTLGVRLETSIEIGFTVT